MNQPSTSLRYAFNIGTLLITLLTSQMSQAETAAASQTASNETFWDFNFYLENDMFAETDANYTNGIRVTFMTSEIDKVNDEKLPSWLARINRKVVSLYDFDTSQGVPQYNFVGTIGQRMYTPTVKKEKQLITTERPYAGWLYLGLANHTRVDKDMLTVELDLGIIGPAALGQEAQDLVHDIRDIDRFEGWDNQLNNEFGVALIYERKKKFETETIRSGFGTDFISHWGFSLGNVATYANAGGEARIGWQIPDDFGTSALRPAGDNTAPGFGNGYQNGIHLFTSFDARWVLQDIFLDGNTFSNSHSVDKKNFVVDMAVGVSLNLGALKLSYARIFRTKEFDLQDNYHSYGSIALSYWKKI